MKIIQTNFAIENLKDIFDYYSIKTNKKVAHKIRKQIFESTRQLKDNPESGQVEFHLEKLNKKQFVETTKIIQRFFENQIIISDIFDTRQYPEKIKRNK